MTRKRFIKLATALVIKIMDDQKSHIDGDTLKFYRDRNINNMDVKSYKEAWDKLKVLRDCVGM